jgi:5'-3' exonuclease
MATTIEYDSKRTVCLVDTSYFVFYRYNATLKWYEFQKKEHGGVKYAELHDDPVFVAAFKKHILADIQKIKKKWGVPNENLMLCLDVPRDSIWRREIYPIYKITRELSTTFNTNVFPIFYKFIETLGLKTLTVKKLEADDVIYLATKALKCPEVVVITNDSDYLQMRTDPRVKLHNMNGKGSDLSKRSVGDPRQDMIIKVLKGDISDNISKVCAKMGEKTAAKLAQLTDDEIVAWVASKGVECTRNYGRNRLLISFDHIPDTLVQDFVANYRFVSL